VPLQKANYGEGGALERFGSSYALPSVYSGHNSFSWWGPPSPALGTTIGVGLDRDELAPYFDSVRLATGPGSGTTTRPSGPGVEVTDGPSV